MPHNSRNRYKCRAFNKNLPHIDVTMLNFESKPVYLACGHTDMRKSINGLAALEESSFRLDPFSDALFVFCNRNRDRIKILEWDGDGFWLYFKRLERGRFRWSTTDDEPTMHLTGQELHLLLGSTKVIQKLKRQPVKTGSIT